MLVMPAGEPEIGDQVMRYVGGQTTLDGFREWLAPFCWDADRRFDPHTAARLHELDLFLSEFDHGDWTEDELKQHVVGLVADYRIQSGSEWLTSSSTAGFQSGQTQHVGMRQTVWPSKIVQDAFAA